MSETNDNMEETLKQVLDALRSTEELLRDVLRDKDLDRNKLTTVEVKLANVEQNLYALLQVVRGDGTEGLQGRTLLLEDRMQLLHEIVKTLREEKEAVSKQNNTGRWSLYVAIATGLLALAGIVFATMLR